MREDCYFEEDACCIHIPCLITKSLSVSMAIRMVLNKIIPRMKDLESTKREREGEDIRLGGTETARQEHCYILHYSPKEFVFNYATGHESSMAPFLPILLHDFIRRQLPSIGSYA